VSGKKLMLAAYSVIFLVFLAYCLSLALRERTLQRTVANLLAQLDKAREPGTGDSDVKSPSDK
jgi:hypothetical protein